RRAARLRRVRGARARHRADVLRAFVLVQRRRLDGVDQIVPARRQRPGRPVGDDGARGTRRGRGPAGRVHAPGGRERPDRRVPLAGAVTWQFSLTGLLIGVLVGLTGMGGGSLMTPILILFFGFKPTFAVGTDLLLGGAGLFAKAFLRPRPDGRELAVLSRRDKAIAFWLGFGGGFIVGLTSVGSGTFFGLVMMLVYPLAARRIVGTDIFHAAALLWVAGFGYLALGKVDLHAMAWLLVGSIPGVLIGSQLGVGLPDRPLRAALATTLVLSGVKIVGVPESSWIIVGALIAGALALGAWKLAQRE